MSERYVPASRNGRMDIFDTTTRLFLYHSYPSWDAALKAAGELNKPPSEPAPAAPCCDCAAKLKAAEDKAERFRHALAQIFRFSAEAHILRYADEALRNVERAEGGEVG